MDDRELLEMAAKAAGIELGAWFYYNTVPVRKWQFMLADRSATWNPLTDDGDRYRLAKALGMCIDFYACMVTYQIDDEEYVIEWDASEQNAEAYAILDAAVEIGRSMP